MMSKKINAGALQLTMFIVIVIALLLASIILLIDTHKRFNLQTGFVIEAIENANKGIDYALENDLSSKDSIHIDLRGADYKTVTVYHDYWGLFEQVISASKIRSNTFKKVALIGGLNHKTDRLALYLEDQNRPLVVVGNTKIQGLSYLPKQGVRTGNISGHSYYGSQLIYGATRESNSLPEFHKRTLEYVQMIQDKVEETDPSQILDFNKKKTFQNSFFNPLQAIYSSTDIILSEVSLTGHILVQSATKIVVEASSKLKDVILIAPQIDIKKSTKGMFQSIATKEIRIGENCSLSYPSAFLIIETIQSKNLTENTSNAETPLITVGKGSNLRGVIAYLSGTKNYKAQVFIDEGAIVTGEIYCNRNLELLGTVNGSVYTSNFIANQSGSSYQNHLYNGTISIDGLPQEYVGLTFGNSKKGIVKWLY